MTDQVFFRPDECSVHTIFPGVQIRTAAGREMMLSLVNLDPGAIVEKHSHPHEQVGMVIQGRARFVIGGQERLLGPGEMYVIPGGVEHRVIAEAEGCQALDVFHPLREDYL